MKAIVVWLHCSHWI